MSEEKKDQIDINSIASAVATAVGKLNTEEGLKAKGEEQKEETFECPECGGKVSARAKYCPGCGCELEWGE